MLSALSILITLPSVAVASPRDYITNILPRSRDTYKEPLPHVHPLTDRSKLKYEIAGIVGAYVLWTLVTALLIVLVRTRLRRRYRALEENPGMTMMKTFHTKETVREIPAPIATNGPKTPLSLKSPGLRSLRSWTSKGHKSGTSVASLNSTVSHEQHKAQNMDDLTKLYEAVMVHDEKRSKNANTAQQQGSPDTSPLSPGYPPEFAHLHNANAVSQPLKSPGYRQGFNGHLINPMAPTPTTDTFAEQVTSPYYDPNIPSRNSSRSTGVTPLSMISNTSSQAYSISSPNSRASIRGQNISQPIGSADMSNAHFYDDNVPLSPRFYNPGPAPPAPGKKKGVHVSVEPIYENDDDPEQYRQHHQQQQYSQHQQYEQSYPVYQQEQDQIPPVPALPMHLPISPGLKSPGLPKSPAVNTLNQSIRDKRIPHALALRASANSETSMNSTTIAAPSPAASKQLAFREMYGDSTALRSAPPTKTTFLERPSKPAALRGPATGVPYSPYTPFTPMTPITPRRLLNKQELKLKRKEERMKTLNEDDLVQDEDDVWGK